MSRQLSIPEFYSGKRVFITGGTGFVGKMIVEKLLRSCSEVDSIYLLSRSKKGKSASERVQELINSPLFNVMRKNNPNAFNKISLIEGDIAKENLGLSEADQTLFYDKINVIIHSAATILFNEPMKVAVATNLQSMKEMMKLARKTKKLDAFVHVSTAYANWFKGDVKEIIYKPNYDPNKVIEMYKTLSDEELKKAIPTVGRYINTYLFTKSLTEYLISQEGHDLPMTIVRPSVVTGSSKEPFPGWIDNWAGPTQTLFMTSKGIFRHAHMKKYNTADIIPSDIIVNMVIAAGWKVGITQINGKLPLEIYNCTSSAINPVTFKELYYGFIENARKYPYNDVLFYPKIRFYSSNSLSNLAVFTFQKIPGYFIDFATKLSGKKPKLIKTIDNLYKQYNSVSWVAIGKSTFYSENPAKLAKSMSPQDLQEFDFDVRKINWKNYLENSYLGIRKHLAKDKCENFPVLRAKVQRLKYLHYLTIGSSLVGSLFLLNKGSKVILSRNENNLDLKE